MQSYDIIMLVVLAATTFLGFRKGLVWQIASVAAIAVSYVVAMQFRHELAVHIQAEPPWNMFLAMLILYVGTSFAIWIVFQLVRGVIDRLKLKDFDHQLGAVFGLAKGALLCIIITLFAVTLLGGEWRQQIIQSKSGFYIARLLDRADAVMPEELHDYLHPYLHQLEAEPTVVEQGGGIPEIQDFDRLEQWLEGAADRVRSGGEFDLPESFRDAAGEAYERAAELGDSVSPPGNDEERKRRYQAFERR